MLNDRCSTLLLTSLQAPPTQLVVQVAGNALHSWGPYRPQTDRQHEQQENHSNDNNEDQDEYEEDLASIASFTPYTPSSSSTPTSLSSLKQDIHWALQYAETVSYTHLTLPTIPLV